MSKHRKALSRICSPPTPSDIKWNELQSILEGLGYKMITNSGSRRKFYNEERDALIVCHKPHPTSIVDKGCVADVAEHLKQYKFI